jgi:hypothetical protein
MKELLMIKHGIGIGITLVGIAIYIILRHSLKKDLSFLNQIVSADTFKVQLSEYTGYVLLAEKSMIQYEARLLRNLTARINKKDRCRVINLSNNMHNEAIDAELVERMEISIIPVILFIDKGIMIREILHFGEFNEISDTKKMNLLMQRLQVE